MYSKSLVSAKAFTNLFCASFCFASGVLASKSLTLSLAYGGPPCESSYVESVSVNSEPFRKGS